MIQAAHGDRAWSVIHSGRSNTDYLQSHLCVCVCGHERGVLLNSFVTWNKRNTKVDAISFLSLGAGDKVCAGPSDCRAFKQDLRHEGCWEQFPCTPPVRVCTAIIDHGGRMETVCSSLTSKRGSWEVSEEVLSVCLSVPVCVLTWPPHSRFHVFFFFIFKPGTFESFWPLRPPLKAGCRALPVFDGSV